jgi:hypothetical protein
LGQLLHAERPMRMTGGSLQAPHGMTFDADFTMTGGRLLEGSSDVVRAWFNKTFTWRGGTFEGTL